MPHQDQRSISRHRKISDETKRKTTKAHQFYNSIKGNNIQEFFFIKTVMRMCAFHMQHDKYSANSQVDQVNQEMVS
jgi:hypothetical protein